MSKKRTAWECIAVLILLAGGSSAATAQLPCYTCVNYGSGGGDTDWRCAVNQQGNGYHTCQDGGQQTCTVSGPCDPQLAPEVTTVRPDGVVMFAAVSDANENIVTPEIDASGRAYVRNCKGLIVSRYYSRFRAAALRAECAFLTL